MKIGACKVSNKTKKLKMSKKKVSPVPSRGLEVCPKVRRERLAFWQNKPQTNYRPTSAKISSLFAIARGKTKVHKKCGRNAWNSERGKVSAKSVMLILIKEWLRKCSYFACYLLLFTSNLKWLI